MKYSSTSVGFALNISSVSGDGPVAVNGTVQEGQNSAELEPEQPQHGSPGSTAATSTKISLADRNQTYRGRASDLFRGTLFRLSTPILFRSKRSLAR